MSAVAAMPAMQPLGEAAPLDLREINREVLALLGSAQRLRFNLSELHRAVAANKVARLSVEEWLAAYDRTAVL